MPITNEQADKVIAKMFPKGKKVSKARMELFLEALLERFEEGESMSPGACKEWAVGIRQLLGKA